MNQVKEGREEKAKEMAIGAELPCGGNGRVVSVEGDKVCKTSCQVIPICPSPNRIGGSGGSGGS